MIENERHRQIMEYLNSQAEPVTCKQIHRACDLLSDTDDAAKVLFYLRRTRGWVQMIGKDPKRYQITAAGIEAVKGSDPKTEKPQPEQKHEEPQNQETTHEKPELARKGLAAALEELIENTPRIGYEPEELLLMASTLRDVYDVLESRLPDHEDLEDFKKAITLIETLRQKI